MKKPSKTSKTSKTSKSTKTAKAGSRDVEHRGGDAGETQQRVRRDRENMGAGKGAQGVGKNQGREGGRGTGRNGKSERGDRARSARK
jgi:hypothetical protein